MHPRNGLFTPAPGHRGSWVRQQRMRARLRSRTSPPPPPPVFEIPTRNHFAPLRETDHDTVIIGDSIVRHVRATVSKGKARTHCLPGARVLDVTVLTLIIVSGPLPTYQRGIERLFRLDGLHPSSVGAEILSDNISRALHTF